MHDCFGQFIRYPVHHLVDILGYEEYFNFGCIGLNQTLSPGDTNCDLYIDFHHWPVPRQFILD